MDTAITGGRGRVKTFLERSGIEKEKSDYRDNRFSMLGRIEFT